MILVTGGTGFIGRYIVERLLDAKEKVRIFSRQAEVRFLSRDRVATEAEHSGAEYFEGTILEPKKLSDAMTGCDRVIHLVGIIRENGKQTFEKIHAEGTRNVVAAAKANGVRKIVHMSALGAKPNAASRYHQSKWDGEEAVRKSGLSYVIFRPSIVVGYEDQFVNLLTKMLKWSPGFVPVLGPGTAKLQPISVVDVATCFVKAVLHDHVVNDAPPGGSESVDAKSEPLRSILNKEYPLTGANVLTLNDLLDMIMRIKKTKRIKIHIPIGAATLLARIMEKVPGQPLNRDQLTMLLEDNIADNSAMKADFGVKPRLLGEVIRGYLV